MNNINPEIVGPSCSISEKDLCLYIEKNKNNISESEKELIGLDKNGNIEHSDLLISLKVIKSKMSIYSDIYNKILAHKENQRNKDIKNKNELLSNLDSLSQEKLIELLNDLGEKHKNLSSAGNFEKGFIKITSFLSSYDFNDLYTKEEVRIVQEEIIDSLIKKNNSYVLGCDSREQGNFIEKKEIIKNDIISGDIKELNTEALKNYIESFDSPENFKEEIGDIGIMNLRDYILYWDNNGNFYELLKDYGINISKSKVDTNGLNDLVIKLKCGIGDFNNINKFDNDFFFKSDNFEYIKNINSPERLIILLKEARIKSIDINFNDINLELLNNYQVLELFTMYGKTIGSREVNCFVYNDFLSDLSLEQFLLIYESVDDIYKPLFVSKFDSGKIDSFLSDDIDGDITDGPYEDFKNYINLEVKIRKKGVDIDSILTKYEGGTISFSSNDRLELDVCLGKLVNDKDFKSTLFYMFDAKILAYSDLNLFPYISNRIKENSDNVVKILQLDPNYFHFLSNKEKGNILYIETAINSIDLSKSDNEGIFHAILDVVNIQNLSINNFLYLYKKMKGLINDEKKFEGLFFNDKYKSKIISFFTENMYGKVNKIFIFDEYKKEFDEISSMVNEFTGKFEEYKETIDKNNQIINITSLSLKDKELFKMTNKNTIQKYKGLDNLLFGNLETEQWRINGLINNGLTKDELENIISKRNELLKIDSNIEKKPSDLEEKLKNDDNLKALISSGKGYFDENGEFQLNGPVKLGDGRGNFTMNDNGDLLYVDEYGFRFEYSKQLDDNVIDQMSKDMDLMIFLENTGLYFVGKEGLDFSFERLHHYGLLSKGGIDYSNGLSFYEKKSILEGFNSIGIIKDFDVTRPNYRYCQSGDLDASKFWGEFANGKGNINEGIFENKLEEKAKLI